MPVIDIAGSEHKIWYLSFVVDNKVKFEAKEPSDAGVARPFKTLWEWALFIWQALIWDEST
jgi:hypothetical protein